MRAMMSSAWCWEMGMRGFGEIRRLCDIARPVIGVVTSVVDAHTERVGDIEAWRGPNLSCPTS